MPDHFLPLFNRLKPLMANPYAQRRKKGRSPTSSQGITIIESLIAISVVALTGILITPPLLIAAATRIQNRRAEQAYQIAQGEIDRVESLVSNGEHDPDKLPEAVNADPIDTEAAPSGLVSLMRSSNPDCPNAYTGQPVAANAAIEVDLTGDCKADFIMQVFRNEGVTSQRETDLGSDRPTTFTMVVRVYAVLGDSTEIAWADLETEQASLKITNGEGNQRTRPLAVITKQMIWGDSDGSVCAFYDGGTCD
jgi:type II secretory pathway pseudopilin PulG